MFLPLEISCIFLKHRLYDDGHSVLPDFTNSGLMHFKSQRIKINTIPGVVAGVIFVLMIMSGIGWGTQSHMRHSDNK